MTLDLNKVLEKFRDFISKDNDFNFICTGAYESLINVNRQLNNEREDVALRFFRRFGKPLILFPYAPKHNGENKGVGYYLLSDSNIGIYLGAAEKKILNPQDFRRIFETDATNDLLGGREDKARFLSQITQEGIIKRLEDYQFEDN